MVELALLTPVLFIPSNVLILYTVFGILGSRPSWPRLLGLSGLTGLGFAVFSGLTGSNGIHVLLHVLLLIAVVRIYGQNRWSVTILVTVLIHLLTAVGEGLVAAPVMGALGYEVVDLITVPTLRMAAGWLSLLPLLVLNLYFYLRKRLTFAEKV